MVHYQTHQEDDSAANKILRKLVTHENDENKSSDDVNDFSTIQMSNIVPRDRVKVSWSRGTVVKDVHG